MPDSNVLDRMRQDWNARAREDAGYFVAFGRRDSSDAEFFATATEVINRLEVALDRAHKEGGKRILISKFAG